MGPTICVWLPLSLHPGTESKGLDPGLPAPSRRGEFDGTDAFCGVGGDEKSPI